MNLLRACLVGSRPLALAVALLGAAGGACAGPAEATDDAFGALLAMPGAQPKDGGWIVPQTPPKDEKALIARWQRLGRQGADFTAMRHRGTLLAHAIRAGKDDAALWLLRNGADPRKVLFDGRDDAWTLALRYGRTAVAAVLAAQYGFAPPAPVARPAAPKPAAPAAPTKEQRSIALLYQLAGPVRQPDAAAQQAWRRYAATLSQDEFRSLFKDGDHIEPLVILTRHTDGGLEEALARLPVELVRRQAPVIAGLLAEWSFVTYGDHPKIEYTGASRSWPALWRRLDQPLHYDKWPELAGRIPPELWAGLFASGYAIHDAEATGCLLAAVDLPALKALWPEFQRDFANARDDAAGLVLRPWRFDREKLPCSPASSPAETVAKLAFLQADGVTAPAWGLRRARPDEPLEPALAALVKVFSPKADVVPRLERVAPDCTLTLDARWWSALAKVRSVGWGIPPMAVQIVQVPGASSCGLLVSGDTYPDWPRFSDSFDKGPSLDPPIPRGADLPDDGEIWIMERDGIRRIADDRGVLTSLREVRDRATGKRYLLDAGRRGSSCCATNELPGAFEWQADAKEPKLVPSGDDFLVTRLLRQQCRASDDDRDIICPGLEPGDAGQPGAAPPLDRLRLGDAVSLTELLDAAGADRRVALRSALADHDHARLRQLLDDGVPAWWLAAEIRDLGKADLPLEEKRRRIALLFADADQLSEALDSDKYELPDALATWLPRRDWKPVLRIVAKAPDAWFDMTQRVRKSVDAVLACELDRAEQFVCGGGVNLD